MKKSWWLAAAAGAILACNASASPGPDASEGLAKSGSDDVVVVVKHDRAEPREVGRLSLRELRFEGSAGAGVAAESSGDVRTVAVAADVERVTGVRFAPGALGEWRLAGAVQEGGIQTRPVDFGRFDGEEARAAEVRFGGARVLGRGHLEVSAGRRNYDPVTGALLGRGGLREADPFVEDTLRYEAGYDLVADQPVLSGYRLDVRASASRERNDAPVAWPGVLSGITPTLTDVLAETNAATLAFATERAAREASADVLPVLLPIEGRIDTAQLGFGLVAPPAEGEKEPRARARLVYGHRRIRRFATDWCCRVFHRTLRPAGAPDRLDGSHFLDAMWQVPGWSVSYGFTLLESEPVPGASSSPDQRSLGHRLNATARLLDSLRLRVLLERTDVTNRRIDRSFAATASGFGFDWTPRSRWTLTGSLRVLDTTAGEGNRTWTLGGRVARVVTPPTIGARGEVFARSSVQHGAVGAAARAGNGPLGLEAGIRITF